MCRYYGTAAADRLLLISLRDSAHLFVVRKPRVDSPKPVYSAEASAPSLTRFFFSPQDSFQSWCPSRSWYLYVRDDRIIIIIITTVIPFVISVGYKIVGGAERVTFTNYKIHHKSYNTYVSCPGGVETSLNTRDIFEFVGYTLSRRVVPRFGCLFVIRIFHRRNVRRARVRFRAVKRFERLPTYEAYKYI